MLACSRVLTEHGVPRWTCLQGLAYSVEASWTGVLCGYLQQSCSRVRGSLEPCAIVSGPRKERWPWWIGHPLMVCSFLGQDTMENALATSSASLSRALRMRWASVNQVRTDSCSTIINLSTYHVGSGVWNPELGIAWAQSVNLISSHSRSPCCKTTYCGIHLTLILNIGWRFEVHEIFSLRN